MVIDGISHTMYDRAKAASVSHEKSSFAAFVEHAQKQPTDTGQPALKNTRLSGDYLSSFDISQPTTSDIEAKPQGLGAHSNTSTEKVIDKTSELYKKSLELESYLVKIMLNSMRSTLGKTSLTGKDSFAGKMYKDMMYEELSRNVTKNAGFGLADQMYLQLSDEV